MVSVLDFFVPFLLEHQFAPQDEDYVVVPIPLHARRLRVRGFNQAELIAEKIGKPICNALIRSRFTRPQTGTVSEEVRRKNISGAFTCPNPSLVRGKRVLVVDDVFTTGATMSEAVSVLREAGAAEVLGFTLART